MTRDDPRDFSERGRRFTDYRGREHVVEYSVCSPLGYRIYVSRQALRHLRRHRFAAERENDIPRVLSNPDLIVPSYAEPMTHLYFKAYRDGLLLLAVQEKEGLRFLVTGYEAARVKGLREERITQQDFLYLRGGFRWKRWR